MVNINRIAKSIALAMWRTFLSKMPLHEHSECVLRKEANIRK